MTIKAASRSSADRRGTRGEFADAEVEIKGRNLILLSKAFVLAALEGWPTPALGTLAGNPDATPSFLADLAVVASRLTLSCNGPDPEGHHCGDCNKCRGRIEAFRRAGADDRPTRDGVERLATALLFRLRPLL